MARRLNEYFPIGANVQLHEFDAERLALLGIRTALDWKLRVAPLWRIKRRREILEGEEYWPQSLSQLYDALLKQSRSHNLVVTAGKNEVALWFINSSFVNGWQYCGIDSSSQAPAVGDTGEVTALGARKSATDKFTTNNVATQSTFFASADNNGTWNASVLAENLTGVPIFARTLFAGAPITKDNTKTETVDWNETTG